MNGKYQKFYNTVMEYYGEYGRYDLPWRPKTTKGGLVKNPTSYCVTVSELMLQQTQASRVIPFFNNWMKVFPSWSRLAQAPQRDVLAAWKGLGYNSRALRLHQLAKIIVRDYHGNVPKDYQALVSLPGIGPYTAGAILAFAYDIYTPMIETNIRRVFIHHFFTDRDDVTDREILDVMDDMGEIPNPGEWYAALMDYGATLPKIAGHNSNTKSRHYSKQSKFEGSNRQIRGRILSILLTQQKISKNALFKKLGKENERYQKICDQLEREEFLVQTKSGVKLV
ncbi:A/G-specific adenine glycosylase [Patescibacteria group bacterium]|nr:A/G-specific adenine glycosylase [Patescibacteria group bacterium]